MKKFLPGWIVWVGLIVVAAGVAFYMWRSMRPKLSEQAFASGNGRIEATEIDIAAKAPGRIKAMYVDEGDFVTAGQVVAQMDTDTLEAQLRQAHAQLRQAQSDVETAQSQVAQRQAEKAAALAVVKQREADLDVAQKRLDRSESLAAQGAIGVQQLDDDRARAENARAAISAAQAQAAAAEAGITTADSHVVGAQFTVEASQATIQRLQADIDDSTLRAPRDGRVQYRIAQPGEVVGAGGRIMNVVDLSDVYMTFFLPSRLAGRLAIGAEARLILDAAPEYVIPATVTFVSDVAQFTPKTVETESERQKLMFRVKAQIPPELLREYIRNVKTGLPGVAYVRIDPNAEWPPDLQVRLPQ